MTTADPARAALQHDPRGGRSDGLHARGLDRPGGAAGERAVDGHLDGAPVPTRELGDLHGTRLQLFETTPGRHRHRLPRDVVGRAPARPVDPLDAITYLRPSRYVQSDTPAAVRPRHVRRARRRRAGARRSATWVHDRLRYESGSTSPTGGAVETLEAGAGVCRDFAHLTAALLRGLDVPGPARVGVCAAADAARLPRRRRGARRGALGGGGCDATGSAAGAGAHGDGAGRDGHGVPHQHARRHPLAPICGSRRRADDLLDRRSRRAGRARLSRHAERRR